MQPFKQNWKHEIENMKSELQVGAGGFAAKENVK